MSSETKIWLTIGAIGQAIFTARFLVQWLASEKKRDTVVPVAFWWLSLAGGTTLLIYAIHRQDPIIVTGQALGVFIYMRNLMIANHAKKKTVSHTAHSQTVPPHHLNCVPKQSTA